jgi:hypothetical protein
VRWIRKGGRRQVYEQHPCEEHKTLDIKPILRRLLQLPVDIDNTIEQILNTKE